MDEPPSHEPGLWKVLVVGTALSFGILLAVMVSMRGFFGGTVSFEISFKTIVGFVIGFVLGWLFWRVVGHLMRKEEKKVLKGDEGEIHGRES